jgi:6-phosphofructokinase 1
MSLIGILTGGGDVPGLNPCIKSFVHGAIDRGHEVIGIRRGWAGLLHYNPDDRTTADEWTIHLSKANTRTIDRSGGTFLHTSRTNPMKVKGSKIPDFLRTPEHTDQEKRFDFTGHVLQALDKLGIKALVAIGGDDTLSYALRLHNEGFPVVAIPKTMDNDVHGTDYCIGFSTAVTRSVGFITDLRTPAGSHERIAIVELFGRHSGETSLISAYLAGVDRAIISEVPFNPEKLARFLAEDKRNNPSNYAIMTISEGAKVEGGAILERGQEDAYGHKKLGGIGALTGEYIREFTGSDIIYEQVAYLMRSGEPDALDRMVAFSFGSLAAELVATNRFGLMTALRQGRYTVVPLKTISEGKKIVDVPELYNAEEYRPRISRIIDKPMFLY